MGYPEYVSEKYNRALTQAIFKPQGAFGILAMWHFVYILAFACIAFLAISNLIRNLMILGIDARRPQGPSSASPESSSSVTPHPELLDEDGNMIREPLLVMRSISVKDAREQLDALYEDSSKDDGASDGGQ